MSSIDTAATCSTARRFGHQRECDKLVLRRQAVLVSFHVQYSAEQVIHEEDAVVGARFFSTMMQVAIVVPKNVRRQLNHRVHEVFQSGSGEFLRRRRELAGRLETRQSQRPALVSQCSGSAAVKARAKT